MHFHPTSITTWPAGRGSPGCEAPSEGEWGHKRDISPAFWLWNKKNNMNTILHPSSTLTFLFAKIGISSKVSNLKEICSPTQPLRYLLKSHSFYKKCVFVLLIDSTTLFCFLIPSKSFYKNMNFFKNSKMISSPTQPLRSATAKASPSQFCQDECRRETWTK